MPRFVVVIMLLVQFASGADSPGFSDFLAGTDGSTVSVSAATHPSDPWTHSNRGSPAVPEAESKACRTDTVLSRSCGMYAVRVTEESGRPLTIEDVAQFAPAP